jgi:hypothetical protein
MLFVVKHINAGQGLLRFCTVFSSSHDLAQPMLQRSA